MTRRQASILVQLRTGHLPLNDYLYKWKLSPSHTCPACTTNRDETMDHILTECPAYMKQRTSLRRTIKGRSLSKYHTLLSDPKRAMAIVTFIENTKHWKMGYMKPAACDQSEN
ncbi:hypothetical protein CPC08DRAFT_648911 [Agrocybe pediades]|nr:hypothetical protein CPC08DRAFT_648911 [Agrocybe pediades]